MLSVKSLGKVLEYGSAPGRPDGLVHVTEALATRTRVGVRETNVRRSKMIGMRLVFFRNLEPSILGLSSDWDPVPRFGGRKGGW